MLKKVISYLSGVIPVLLLSSCSPIFDRESDYQYSAFHYTDQKTWGSLEEAKKKPKFNSIIEVSKHVGEKQTPEQKKAADELYQKTFDHIKKMGWHDFDTAMAAGYGPGIDWIHWANPEFVYDDEVLNPEKPEFLMFYRNPNGEGHLLVGVMFAFDDVITHGPQVGGPETVWHFHDYPEGYCYDIYIPEGHPWLKKFSKKGCEKGYMFHRSPEMMHIWFVDNPYGRFASSMHLENEKVLQGLEIFK